MSVVGFAVGNPSRGDDALGPLLMAGLVQQARPGVHLVSDFQLQIEHALDLEGHQLALFIDAGTGTPAPFDFREIGPAATRPGSSHALAPGAVVQGYAHIPRRPPPAPLVLCLRGEDFRLGEGLSPAAERNLAAARGHLERCLEQADPACWRRYIDSLAASDLST